MISEWSKIMQKIDDELKLIQIKVPSALKEKFREACDDREMSHVLRLLILKFIKSKNV